MPYQPLKLREYLSSPAAKEAKEFNDKLRAVTSCNCPYCGTLLENPMQTHTCTREARVA